VIARLSPGDLSIAAMRRGDVSQYRAMRSETCGPSAVINATHRVGLGAMSGRLEYASNAAP
jgi:hypothetical protein